MNFSLPIDGKYPLVLLLTFCYIWYKAIYRLYFHPLAHVPGPRLAAITYGWMIYWNVIRGGILVHQLPALHQKYGRVVRISPNEVHINESEVYHEIYRPNSKFLKCKSLYNGFGFPTSTFALRDPVKHRIRRETIAPFFSKRSVDNLHGHLNECLDALFDGLEVHAKENKPVPLQSAFYCTAVDVISYCAFGESFNMLRHPGFKGEEIDMVLAFTNGFWVIVHFPLLVTIALKLPRRLGKLIAGPFLYFRSLCEKLVADFMRKKENGELKKDQATIFDALVEPRPEKEYVTPSFDDLVDEAISLLTGGTDTTAEIMSYAVYYYLIHSEVRVKLLEEIRKLDLDEKQRVPLPVLQQQPYLSAFIKEVLRMANATPGRLPREVPAEGLFIQSTGTYLPPGTTVSVCHAIIHQDPSIFVDPQAFTPERWLTTKGGDRWLMSFSKGSRACLGNSLALAEIYLVLGNLFRTFDMKLWETTARDMEWIDQAVVHTRGKLQVKLRRISN